MNNARDLKTATTSLINGVDGAVGAFLYNEHRCLNCKKAVTNYAEYQFMIGTGRCLGCDHLEGEKPHETA